MLPFFWIERQRMKVAKPNAVSAVAAKPRGLFFAALLAVVLAALFWKSFLPGYVHFSNDGPLAQQVSAYDKLPGAFTGIWGDLNDIGNSGGSLGPDLGTLFRWLVGPVGYAKFLAPYALFILGLGAWTFFRQLKLSPLAATLGGLAAALNSAFFSTACWGVAAQQIAAGFGFFALALVVSNTPETPALTRWVRWVLAGLAVGLDVMHGADIGAIFSVFIAAFVVARTLAVESGPVPIKLARGVGRVVIIAVFAGFIAAQTVVSLIGTSISGVAGAAQNADTKAKQWNWATQWSQPKIETLAVFVPGLFGYKLDTPNNMEMFPDAYEGGNYWGAVGRDPVLDQFFANGAKGTPPPHQFMRQTGGGPYAGILVVLIAVRAIGQSWRRQNSVFGEKQRRMIWFWTAVLVVALLLCWGRWAPFYAILYQLPYASLVRNPTKFLLVLSWALVILFAYGVDGLSRRHLQAPAANFKSSLAQLQSWWRNVRGFDRKWAAGCLIALAVSVLAWLLYWTQEAALVKYLQSAYEDGDPKQIAAFSVASAGWFLPFFAAAIGLVLLILAGIFSGQRARLGGFLLGALLLVDLGRANLPWMVYWNYPQKYATNPIIDILRNKPYEHRVVELRSQSLFEQLYDIEWVQQLFPYYNIQSLDLVMRPRVGSDLEIYESNFMAAPQDPRFYSLLARHWQLTNGRYFLGPANYLDFLNQNVDPAQHRFRIVQRFTITAKPGVERATQLTELTAAPDNNGSYALFEFTGALPRAKLYSNWQWPKNDQAAVAELTPADLGTNGWSLLQQVGTNDFLTLKELASPSFDPWKTVFLADAPAPPPPPATATNGNSGAVEFTNYSPTDIKLHTQAPTPTVLLLNDQYDPHWSVTVDGKPAPLLRANFIMRGVYLPAGEHSVEFRFRLPIKPLYVTVSAMVLGILLCGFLFYLEHKPRPFANGKKST
jgi:hypothetical protein